jgi:hypothetical protein
MFGLTQVFTSFRRLAEAVGRTAELFEAANVTLEGRLTVGDEPAVLEDRSDSVPTRGRNGKVKA